MAPMRRAEAPVASASATIIFTAMVQSIGENSDGSGEMANEFGEATAPGQARLLLHVHFLLHCRETTDETADELRGNFQTKKAI